MPRSLPMILLLAGATLAGAMSANAQAAAFDGNWSVLVVTDKGTCDRAYRYAIAVANGKVLFTGGESVHVTGTVDPSGNVQVNISRGNQAANGTGRLSATSGTGTWAGRSAQQQCSGHWEAERR